MIRIAIIVLMLSVSAGCASSRQHISHSHAHPEKYYQERWCTAHGGITEYVLPDRTRVDCLTEDYAIEFDFAQKWAESIGQALYYSEMTGKRPGVVLIMEKPAADEKHMKRLRRVSDRHGITVWKMTSDD